MTDDAAEAPMPPNASGLDLLADHARRLADEENPHAVWQRVVDFAVAQIPGAQFAGITLLQHDGVTTPVASDDFVCEIDKRQYDVKNGPCLDAAFSTEPLVCSDDITTETRWPDFSAAVADLGVRSVLCFRLYTANGTIGALNLYSKQPSAFGEESCRVGLLVAAHAAVATQRASTASQLREAIESRDTIGQAKGMLMERYRVDAERAFDLLMLASQHTHRKIKVVAQELVETGEISTG